MALAATSRSLYLALEAVWDQAFPVRQFTPPKKDGPGTSPTSAQVIGANYQVTPPAAGGQRGFCSNGKGGDLTGIRRQLYSSDE